MPLIRKIQTLFLIGSFTVLAIGCTSPAEIAAEAGAEARRHFDQQNYFEARKSITNALSERDDDPQLHILKGRIELASGRRTDAFLAYSDALSLESTNPEALQAVSQLGLQTGYLREAERAADTMLSFSPELPEALLTKGLIALVRRKYKDALELSERILAVRPGDEAGLILKARILGVTNKTSDALEVLLSSSNDENYTEGVDLTLIELYRETSNLEQMKATFKRLMARRPDDVALRLDYANTLYKTGEGAEARAVIEKLLRNNLTQRQALTTITELWLEYETAPLNEGLLAFLEKEGSLESRIEITRYLLAIGKPEEGERILRSVSSRFSVEATALHARTLFDAGETEEALHIASDILEDDETNADALLIRAKQAISERDYGQAKNDLQIVIRDNPKLRAGYLSLVDVYKAQNDNGGVKRVFTDASKQLPQDLILFRAYANHLIENDDSIRAVAITRGFARDTPASIKAWQLYQDVCARAALDRCKLEALAGEKVAKIIYAIDLPPGAPPTRGLFGRLR